MQEIRSLFVLYACPDGAKAAKPVAAGDQAHLDSVTEIPTCGSGRSIRQSDVFLN
jgi:hypothetical protein